MSTLLRPFESKVGGRLVLLFGSCALLPLLAMAALSYRSIRGHLLDSGEAELRAGSKSYAMSLIDRLELLETALHDAGARSASVEDLSPAGREVLRSRFSEVGLVSTEGTYSEWIGDPRRRRQRATEDWTDFEIERALVIPSEDPRIVVAIPGGQYLVGTARADYLWWGSTMEDTLPRSTDVVVLSGEDVLFASHAMPAGLVDRLARFADSARRDVFRWPGADGAILTGYWTMPLGIHFESPDWTVAWLRPEEAVFSPLERFQTPFVLVLVATFLGIFWLSLRQIRRTLSPLEELKRGTERIAAREFDARVTVSSDDEFSELASSFNEMAERMGDLVGRLAGLQLGTIRALSRSIDERSKWTLGHSERVGVLSRRLARRLGLGEEEQESLYQAGLLHDVGKLRIPSEILDRPGALTLAEKMLFQGHVEAGVRILEPIPDFERILPMVAQHHERLDGSGYPAGLQGSEIGMGARILAVADSFDAMSSDRPYRLGLPADEIVAELRRCSGSLYDEEVVEMMIEICGYEGETARAAMSLLT